MTFSRNLKGSIMIWTLMMGVSLAVVFFFFSLRLNSSVTAQRQTMEYLNARLLTDSYEAYLENLSAAQLNSIKGPINFHGLTGTLTNDSDQLTGVVDEDAESSPFHFGGSVKIEWNLCSKNLKADLILKSGAETTHAHHAGPSCSSSNPDYDDSIPATVVTDPFTLKSNGAPFYYRITSTVAGTPLPGPEWLISFNLPVSFRKNITVNKAFVPAS